MSNFVFCDEALADHVNYLDGQGGSALWSNGKAGLFVANITPTRSKVAADVTGANEATFAGYARITLSSGNWPAAAVASNVASATYSVTLTFTRSTTGTVQNVYGFFLLNNAGTKLIGLALLDTSPTAVTNSGDTISVTFTLGALSHFT